MDETLKQIRTAYYEASPHLCRAIWWWGSYTTRR